MRDQPVYEFSGSAIDVVESVSQVGSSDPETIRFALRAALCSSKEEWDLFDRLFHSQPEPRAKPEVKAHGSHWRPAAVNAAIASAALDSDGRSTVGASLQERLRKTDFSSVAPDHRQQLERLAQRLLQQTSYRLSHRLRIAERKERVDLRRTIRRSISRGGHPFDLQYRRRKSKPARLVLLLDVSGSMSLYSLFLLRFAHALAKYFRQTRTFLFSTTLMEVTRSLRSRQFSGALRALAEMPVGWSGGTRIGESLREFHYAFGSHALRRDALLIVMSDGWDTGDPEMLASELRAIKSSVRKVVWLNPLLGLEDYQPLTRGMAAALPYIDVFAPAHSLDSLLDLERHLHV